MTRMSGLKWLGGLMLGLMILLHTGCGSGENRQPIFGKIIGAEGQNGSLSLVPADGGEGPSALTVITDGAYKFDSYSGPAPGPHSAHILLEKGTSPAAAGDNPKVLPLTPGESPLGKQYSVKVTVPAQAPYELDIGLSSGASSGDRR